MFEWAPSVDPGRAGSGPVAGVVVDGAPDVPPRSAAEVVLDRLIRSLVVEVGSLAHVRPGAPAPALQDVVPGPGLAARLAGVSLGDLSREGLLDVVDGWERLASWAVAQQARVLEELAVR